MRRSTTMAVAVAMATALAGAANGRADDLHPMGTGETGTGETGTGETGTRGAGASDGDLGPRASLMGRIASFKALAYDDPAKPLFDGFVHSSHVSDDVEFGMGPEGVQNNLDVVPATVDVSAHRIEVSFALAPHPGVLVEATFNGYLLAFEPDCLVIDRAEVDRDWSTMAFEGDDLIFEGRTLKINLAGRPYDATSRIGIDLSVDDCPMS